MKVTLDHIGIAVSNLEEALAFYRDALGLEVGAPEEVPSQGVRAHFVVIGSGPGVTADRDDLAPGVTAERGDGVPAQQDRGIGAPGVTLELLEATSDGSPIAKYVAKRGPGVHHITLRVDDIVAALARLKSRGVRLVDEVPRPGGHGSLVAFVHPSSAHGVLVELTQY
jgi:catechol 2,3-dioxygenase-like lactoylglutathione lyase family enzyme